MGDEAMNAASDTGEAQPGVIHTLMSGLIDYAGLFPPAKLGMPDAIDRYSRHLASPDAWMLGRFILPCSRIEEFEAAATPNLPTRALDDASALGAGGWPISVLIDGDFEQNLEAIFAFNERHLKPSNGLAFIDAIEIKVPDGDARDGAAYIDGKLEEMPEGLYPFFELNVMPASRGAALPDLRGAIAALSGADAGAKVRTGGIVPEAIPSTRAVAEFIATCAAGDVPFKATAGLHHIARGEQALTYEPGCPRAVMHGFLNVFVAAGFARAHEIEVRHIQHVLDEGDARAFVLGEQGITWRGHTLELEQIDEMREAFALSFGSCSFDEPVGELRALGLV